MCIKTQRYNYVEVLAAVEVAAVKLLFLSVIEKPTQWPELLTPSTSPLQPSSVFWTLLALPAFVPLNVHVF